MPEMIDISGQRYGKLTVIKYHGLVNRRYLWECLCDCGKTTLVEKARLSMGKTKSCGCFKKEHTRTHGLSKTTTYDIWARMKSRCYSPTSDKYQWYGARGIKVCDRWFNSYENFLEDMGERPSNDYSLDRIDVNGDYTPENCRWATHKEQCRNRRSNIRVLYEGVDYCLAELCEKLDLKATYIRQAIKKYKKSIGDLIPGAELITS